MTLHLLIPYKLLYPLDSNLCGPDHSGYSHESYDTDYFELSAGKPSYSHPGNTDLIRLGGTSARSGAIRGIRLIVGVHLLSFLFINIPVSLKSSIIFTDMVAVSLPSPILSSFVEASDSSGTPPVPLLAPRAIAIMTFSIVVNVVMGEGNEVEPQVVPAHPLKSLESQFEGISTAGNILEKSPLSETVPIRTNVAT